MNDNEYYDFEGRRYVSPTLSRDEQLQFADALRGTMNRNTAQINTQTKNLGTDVPSNLGGLTGSNSYFSQRYQTTPVESQVNTLKAVSQAKAMNDLMTNYQNQYKNRVQQAYRSAARRAKNNSGGNGGGGNGGGGGDTEEVDVGYDYARGEMSGDMSTGWTYISDTEGKYYYAKDSSGAIRDTNDPNYYKASDGKYYKVGQNNKDFTYYVQNSGLALPFASSIINALGGTNYSQTDMKTLIGMAANQRAAERAASQNKGGR